MGAHWYGTPRSIPIRDHGIINHFCLHHSTKTPKLLNVMKATATFTTLGGTSVGHTLFVNHPHWRRAVSPAVICHQVRVHYFEYIAIQSER
ncbi:hypothetical protein CDAR_489971 [Caerostris darwini]|uniref:Uncharacterized protein n=1 Tax=Caerostris darwini TaxID=1538125 RepID=A0AAV4TIR4_9ARAC|nr:hypothetical protein CDAR_489971 [Caerostris darwini]